MRELKEKELSYLFNRYISKIIIKPPCWGGYGIVQDFHLSDQDHVLSNVLHFVRQHDLWLKSWELCLKLCFHIF